MPEADKIYLYWMTHIQNVEHILKHGITHIQSPERNPGYVPIGDGSLIDRRNHFPLQNGRRLGDYIPFYFSPRMPMLYVIQNGFYGINSVSPQNIVYCITTVAALQNSVDDILFTDSHPIVKGLSDFYSAERLEEIDSIIDRKAIRSKYWNDVNDLDLKRRKEAEFLSGNDIPPEAIIGFTVYNKAAKLILADLPGIKEKPIIVKPEYYF